jgi:hypothetical protein
MSRQVLYFIAVAVVGSVLCYWPVMDGRNRYWGLCRSRVIWCAWGMGTSLITLAHDSYVVVANVSRRRWANTNTPVTSTALGAQAE